MAEQSRKIDFERIQESERPEEPKFSIEYMDKTVDPLEDFFSFCNKKWMDTHPIPKDKSSWGGFMELRDRNIFILGKIAEECALKSGNRTDIERMVGDFYTSIMDTKILEERKFSPVQPLMDKIDSIKKKSDVMEVVQTMHSKGIDAFFNPFSMPDEKNSEVYALYFYQGGLSLPNRDYYLLDSFKQIREDYLKHIEKMFVLYGLSTELASEYAKKVMGLEDNIAKSNRPQADLRDSEKNYNRMTLADIEKRYNHMDFLKYIQMSDVPDTEYVVIGQPEVVDNINKLINESDLENLKVYLKWNVLSFAAPYLHKEVDDENFDFFNRKLLGQEEPEKRWKTAVGIIDSKTGETLGQLYVEREFGDEAKERMETMVNDIRSVFVEKLKNLTWMSEVTKEKALEKFSKFRPKIGYPSKFLDYSTVVIKSDDLLGNIMSSNSFEFNREAKRVGTPVDRELWEMTPPTVNAYFNPTMNEIVFPAGILQPPFFDASLDIAVNYGGIGGVISHEITHGFDDQGRNYDVNGNLKDWWTPEDGEAFKGRAKEVVELYGSHEILPELKVNGQLTLGENIADLGGVSIAFAALQRRLNKNPELRKKIDGLTPEQRFFISWSQIWRGNNREQETRRRISIDPHSPNSIRGALPVRNHEKFEDTFAEFSKSKKKVDKKIFIW
jgi:putative endopeptidase